MKIRTGFVSNSSSSSFLIYGALIDENILPDNYDDSLGDYVEELSKNAEFVETVFGQESVYLGKSPFYLPLDMTMREWQDKIQSEIEGLLGKPVKCGWHEESWYDG